MSTFDRLNIAVVTALAIISVAGVDCGGSSSDCFRYSDCAAGLTCAAGKCVAPPASAPSDDGSADAASVVIDAGTGESTLPDADDAQTSSDTPAE